MKNDFCQLWLTCKNEEEADKIVNTLLVKYLIVCAKQIPVKADYWWEGKIEHSDEILLVMDSKLSYFQKVEAEVAKLHSYDTFVLEVVPINQISTKATGWMENEFISGSR